MTGACFCEKSLIEYWNPGVGVEAEDGSCPDMFVVWRGDAWMVGERPVMKAVGVGEIPHAPF
jgi:hypothetical protein